MIYSMLKIIAKSYSSKENTSEHKTITQIQFYYIIVD